MKTLENIQVGDYVAIPFSYNGGEPEEIIVDKISLIQGELIVVHFLYGYKSLAETVRKSEIIAIGDKSAKGKIKGWSGNYNILKPKSKLLCL